MFPRNPFSLCKMPPYANVMSFESRACWDWSQKPLRGHSRDGAGLFRSDLHGLLCEPGTATGLLGEPRPVI